MSSSILSSIRNLLPGGPVYVRISSKALVLRDSATGSELSIEPVLLIAGEETRKRYKLASNPMPFDGHQEVPKRVNGFEHPRSVIGDFTVAEQTLKLALQALFRERKLAPSPVLVLHPVEKTDGGLTSVEHRALMELGEGAGGRKVHVWEGHVLTDAELKAGNLFAERPHSGV